LGLRLNLTGMFLTAKIILVLLLEVVRRVVNIAISAPDVSSV